MEKALKKLEYFNLKIIYKFIIIKFNDYLHNYFKI